MRVLATSALVASAVLLDSAAAPTEKREAAPSRLHLKRNIARRTQNLADFALAQKAGLLSRYGSASERKKRATGVATLTDYGLDSSYYATISTGSPSQSFFVIIDTGSSDTWIAATGSQSSSSSSGSSIPTYSTTKSTTAKALGTKFQVQYGSGAAAGTLYQDTMTIANLTAASQIFAAVTQESSGLLGGDVSGLSGFAWPAIANSGATPLWQSAGVTNFGVALTRYQNDTSAEETEPGGVVDLNFVDSTLYTGSLNYVNLLAETYWLVSMDSVKVNGNTVSGVTNQRAAIDTGTTLIGAPASAVRSVYNAISGSQALSGQYSGYYTYPCAANPNVSLVFGGVSYPIAAADFNLGQFSTGSSSSGYGGSNPYGNDPFGGSSNGGSSSSSSGAQCLGAIFEIDASGTSASFPQWIVGDTFLKGVYTAFRGGSSPAVGFATASYAVEQLNGEAALSSTGSVNVSNTSINQNSKSAASHSSVPAFAAGLVALALGGLAML